MKVGKLPVEAIIILAASVIVASVISYKNLTVDSEVPLTEDMDGQEETTEAPASEGGGIDFEEAGLKTPEEAEAEWNARMEKVWGDSRRTLMLGHVVMVSCPETSLGSVFENKGKVTNIGTGIVVASGDKTSDWLVITNAHVVSEEPREGSAFCTVSLFYKDSDTPHDEYMATVKYVARGYPYIDFAILDPITTYTYGENSLRECEPTETEVGDSTEIVGFPDTGTGQRIVTSGKVSAVHEVVEGTVVETNALVRPGNSGGLAINTDKSCSIGVVTWGTEDETIGYIQSWDMLEKALDAETTSQ
jgi:S1-C subfamily serine protease